MGTPTPTEVRGFLGMAGVIRRWIQDFTKIAKPLTVLRRKMVPREFVWTEEAQGAMDKLKVLALTAVPVKALDYDLVHKVEAVDQRESDLGLVTIQVDSSIIGVGWMIAQRYSQPM